MTSKSSFKEGFIAGREEQQKDPRPSSEDILEYPMNFVTSGVEYADGYSAGRESARKDEENKKK